MNLQVRKFNPMQLKPIVGKPAQMAYKITKRGFNTNQKMSLSNYFPAGTTYFYGYPDGDDSSFLLRVPPKIEELVAARPLACAGSGVSVVVFAATQPPKISSRLISKFNVPQLPDNQVVTLPETITSSLHGKKRDKAIKTELKKLVSPRSLIMAQPFTDRDMAKIYQIPANIANWLNDKKNMSQYIPSELLPKRLALFKSAAQLRQQIEGIHLPFVIKVSSSSSGDGVYICLSPPDIKKAVVELGDLTANILIEEFVPTVKNYGIHFGIPYDSQRAIELIGINEQITTPGGAFIGGIIDYPQFPSELKAIRKALLQDILPSVRQRGWYGVGCFDVLQNVDGTFRFVDSNFRMTGVTVYHFLKINNLIKAPLMSFGGEFKGSEQELINCLADCASADAKDQYVQLIALNHDGKAWNFNGCLTYSNPAQLKQRAAKLLSRGVKSSALKYIST